MAEPCNVDYVITQEDTLDISGIGIRIIRLPGHSINQIGVEYENVLFCGDSLFSEETLSKHKIPFHVNIGEAKKSLEYLLSTKYDLYIPSHVAPTKDLESLIRLNLGAIDIVGTHILEALNSEKTSEQLLRDVCKKMEINIGKIQQYYLLMTSLLAYLSFFSSTKKVNSYIQNNGLFWRISR